MAAAAFIIIQKQKNPSQVGGKITTNQKATKKNQPKATVNRYQN